MKADRQKGEDAQEQNHQDLVNHNEWEVERRLGCERDSPEVLVGH